MRLLKTANHLIRELRRWDLAPLGAVLVAAILCAGAVAFVVTAQHNPSHSRFEATIRTYFETKTGAQVPHEQAQLIHVRSCTRFPYRDVILGVLQTQAIYKCSISFEHRGFVACFAFDQGHIVAGRAQLNRPELGCPMVGWNASSRSLVVN